MARKKREHRYEENVKLDSEYAGIVGDVVSQTDEKSRQAVSNVMASEDFRKMDADLKQNGVPVGERERFYRHGMNDLAQGKPLSAEAVIGAVAEQMSNYRGYIGALKAMKKDGLIKDREYKEYIGRMQDDLEEGSERVTSGLEDEVRKVGVYLFIFIGGILALFGGMSITGAVVGTSLSSSPLSFYLGIVLLVVGLLLMKRR